MKRRKAGDPDGALQIAREALREHPQDLWLRRAAAWAIYDIVKRSLDQGKRQEVIGGLEALGALALPKEEDIFWVQWAWTLVRVFRLFGAGERQEIRPLDRVVELSRSWDWPRPSEAYSIWLSALVSPKGRWPGRLEALREWDLKHLRPEDHQPRINKDGKRYMSLAESAHGAEVKGWLEFMEDHPTWRDDAFLAKAMEDSLRRLEDLEAAHPEFTYTAYYRARLLKAARGKGEALAAYLPFVGRQVDKYWVWELLGDLLDDDREKAVACYLRALDCRTPEAYLVNTHWKLARAFQGLGHREAMEWHARQSERIRLENGWSIPPALAHLLAGAPIDQEGDPPGPEFYRTYREAASALLDSSTPMETVVITYVNLEKKVLHFVLSGDREGHARMPKGGGDWQRDDILRCRLLDRGQGRYELKDVQKAAFHELSGLLRWVEGLLQRRDSQSFGRVGDVFLPPHILDGERYKTGMKVRALAVRSFDRKAGRWGWKAISLEVV